MLPEVATFVDVGEVVAVLRDPFGELIATYTGAFPGSFLLLLLCACG